MAIGFTLLYIISQLLGATRVFGSLAEFRVELIVSWVAVLVSIPSFARSQVLHSRIVMGIGGISLALFFSTLMQGWVGGLFPVFYAFLPSLLGFFLVAVNCKTKFHLQLVILVLFCGCAFNIFMGVQALREGGPSPFVYLQGVDEGSRVISRIRGEQFIADPNDFGQLMVMLVPLMFFFRRKGSVAVSILFVIPAVGVLLTGIFLSHSRGALLALMAMAVFAGRRKIGLFPAAIGTGLVFLGALAVGMTGGREVSADGGADRIELWATGLHLVKEHFLFGVGAGNFRDYAPNTAHNSVVICAAEAGVVGLIGWVLMILAAFRSGLSLTRVDHSGEEAPGHLPRGISAPGVLIPNNAFAGAAYAPWRQPNGPHQQKVEASQNATTQHLWGKGYVAELEKVPEDELRRFSQFVIYALVGFLTAGWFLSRAFSIWLFILCGMMHVLVRIGAAKGVEVARDRVSDLLRWSVILAIVLMSIISVIIRVTGGH